MTDTGPFKRTMHGMADVEANRPPPDLRLRDATFMDMFREMAYRIRNEGAVVMMHNDGTPKTHGACGGNPIVIADMLAHCIASIPGSSVAVHVGTVSEMREKMNRLDPQPPAQPSGN